MKKLEWVQDQIINRLKANNIKEGGMKEKVKKQKQRQGQVEDQIQIRSHHMEETAQFETVDYVSCTSYLPRRTGEGGLRDGREEHEVSGTVVFLGSDAASLSIFIL